MNAVRYDRPDHAGEIEVALTRKGPFAVLELLGIGHRREGRRAVLSCPFHAERTPSAKFWVGDAGTLQLHCHGACGRSWNVHALVAVVHGLDDKRKSDFPKVLALGAALAGIDLDTPSARSLPPPRRLAPALERPYPPAAEVVALWAACRPVLDDAEAVACLEGRALDPYAVETFSVARALPRQATLPRWARYRDHWWTETGHRLIVPMFNAAGVLRSVRTWRVTDNETPKRLPPAGYRAGGLVMADALGRRLLEHDAAPAWWPEGTPLRVVVAEGEPDFLTWATRFSDADETAPAVFGIVSGSWSHELAARVPNGARVVVRTDADAKGDAYAEQIYETLKVRCLVERVRRA